MEQALKQIKFDNQNNPKSYFEIVRIEELLKRRLDHNIFKNHIVNFYIIFYVSEGTGVHTIDGEDYQYNSGTVLLVRKDQVHKFVFSSNVRGRLLIFTEEFIKSHLSNLEALKNLQLFNEYLNYPKIELDTADSQHTNFSNLVDQIQDETKQIDEHSVGITRSLLHVLIAQLFRIKSSDSPLNEKKKYLKEFIHFQELVEKNCFTSKKVLDYAGRMGLSAKKLNQVVQSVVNKPAKAFIDEIAILQIKRLLFSTNLSIKEIAYDVGFDDPANFSKYFKKFTGSPPDMFRQTHQ